MCGYTFVCHDLIVWYYRWQMVNFLKVLIQTVRIFQIQYTIHMRFSQMLLFFYLSGCQEAELPPVLAPLPSLTPRTTELWPPPTTTTTHPHTHTHTHTHTHSHSHSHTHTHTHTHCDKHRSLCTALDWPHSTTSSDSLNKKDCSLSL